MACSGLCSWSIRQQDSIINQTVLIIPITSYDSVSVVPVGISKLRFGLQCDNQQKPYNLVQ